MCVWPLPGFFTMKWPSFTFIVCVLLEGKDLREGDDH